MAGAAFFDLDRTLLREASGPILSRTLREAGLVRGKLPAESIIYWWFNTFGESLPAIALARQAVLTALGKPEGHFDDAAHVAADVLVPKVPPVALALIKEHQAAGRPVVLATTTPYHLIKPLADRLGMDDVIATRYAVGDQGTYNGRHDGPFVWSKGKLSAVRAWAGDQHISLRDSFAYSDSIFDLPLLSAVGHPHPVNPDPRLYAVALLRRWPIVYFDSAPGAFRLPVVDVELRRIVSMLARPETLLCARWDIRGLENIPDGGGVILAGNHRSYFDMATMALVIGRTGRTASFLAKRELFDVPLLGQVMAGLGGIRVDRDHSDPNSQDPLETAAIALAAGDMVGILPEGTIPRGLDFFTSQLRGYTGAARLAAMSGAPVVPFAIAGTEKVWPRSASVPNLFNVTHPPTVTVNIGEPVDLDHLDEAADMVRILNAISDLLPEGAGDVPVTSLEQVAATYPGGRIPPQDLPDIEDAIAANVGRAPAAGKAAEKAVKGAQKAGSKPVKKAAKKQPTKPASAASGATKKAVKKRPAKAAATVKRTERPSAAKKAARKQQTKPGSAATSAAKMTARKQPTKKAPAATGSNGPRARVRRRSE